jgi:hypothetical protein
MDSIWELIRPWEVLKAIFQFGYIPKKEEFYELTPAQYDRFYATAGKGDTRGEKIFMFLPHDTQKYIELADGDVFIMTESEMDYFFNKAEKIIDMYCKDSKTPLLTLEDKLSYIAQWVPDVIIEGTKYERKKTKVVYLKKPRKS